MSKPIDKTWIVSSPKMFEPVETQWSGGAFPGLTYMLLKHPGKERGDLIYTVVRHPLDIVGVDKRKVELSEFFYSTIFRWDGLRWECVGFQK